MSNNPFLLVLGMHRSGTSALAGVIDRLGFNAGSEVLAPQSDNPGGFWENTHIVDIHDSLLGDFGSSWDDPVTLQCEKDGDDLKSQCMYSLRQVIDKEFGGTDLPYVKDPRLSQFIELWIPILKELEWQPRCLIIIRHPLEVAESLRKRNGMDHQSAVLLWLKANINIEYQTRSLQRCFLSYEGLMDDPGKEMCRVLSSLKYDQCEGGAIETAVNFIDKNQWHNNQSDLSIESSDVYVELSRQVYAGLISLVQRDSEEGTQVLDQCRIALEKYEALAMPWVGSSKRVLANTVALINDKIESAHQTLINTEIDSSDLSAFKDSVTRTSMLVDELVSAVTKRIMMYEDRAVEREKRAHECEIKARENEAELEACRALLKEIEGHPIKMLGNFYSKSIIKKFKR